MLLGKNHTQENPMAPKIRSNVNSQLFDIEMGSVGYIRYQVGPKTFVPKSLTQEKPQQNF